MDATDNRQPYHGAVTQNNQQHSVPNLKTSSLRFKGTNVQ